MINDQKVFNSVFDKSKKKFEELSPFSFEWMKMPFKRLFKNPGLGLSISNFTKCGANIRIVSDKLLD